MKSSTHEIVAKALLTAGSIAALLAFAAYDAGAQAGQLAFFVGALLQSLIVLMPSVFMWAVLRGVADLKLAFEQQLEGEEHARFARLFDDESVQKVIVERPGRDAVVIQTASDATALEGPS